MRCCSHHESQRLDDSGPSGVLREGPGRQLMCGIAGTVVRSGDVDNQLLAAERAQAHRGPDGTGRLVARVGEWSVGLAHQRLAVIDLSAEGAQPMAAPDGNDAIVFNGELYNYIELRRRLQSEGITFVTETDTEVV